MRRLPAQLVPYDPGDPGHVSFVRDSFVRGARLGARPDGTYPPGVGHAALDAHLSEPGASCVVAHVPGEASLLMGWGLRIPRAVVWVYVKPAVRGRGLAGVIAEALKAPRHLAPLLYWSPSAQRCAALGRVYYAPFLED